MNPCVDWCYNHLGKEYTEKCDSCCEYAMAVAELRRAREALDFARTKDAEIVRLGRERDKARMERDNLIRRTSRQCWSCIRRYECNSRRGSHKRCWEFDTALLRED